MRVTVEDGKLLEIKGDKDNPDSQGFLCVRGQAAHQIIGNPKRILTPLIRDRRGEDSWREASWDDVLDRIVACSDSVGRAATAICVNDNLAAGQPGVTVRSTHDEAPRRIDQDLRLLREQTLRKRAVD